MTLHQLPAQLAYMLFQFLHQQEAARLRCVDHAFCRLGTRSAQATCLGAYAATLRQLADRQLSVRAHRPRILRVDATDFRPGLLKSLTHRAFSSRVHDLTLVRSYVEPVKVSVRICPPSYSSSISARQRPKAPHRRAALVENKTRGDDDDAYRASKVRSTASSEEVVVGPTWAQMVEKGSGSRVRELVHQLQAVEEERANPQICLLPLRALASTLRRVTLMGSGWQWAHTLRSLTQLEYLDARHLNREELRSLPVSLRVLRLETSSDDLAPLQHLTALQRLEFTNKHRRSARVLRRILRAPALRVLVCGHFDTRVAGYTRIPPLQALEVARTWDESKLLTNLALFGARLVHLALPKVPASRRCILRQLLRSLPHLRSLKLYADREYRNTPDEDKELDAEADAAAAPMASLVALELCVSGAKPHVWPLALHSLQYLKIYATHDSRCLFHGYSSLLEVDLHDPYCDAKSIPRLTMCTHALGLRVLNLAWTQYHRIEWSSLAIYKKLRVLHLSHTILLDDPGCMSLLLGDRLRGLPSLVELAFEYGSMRLPHLLVLSGLVPSSWCFAVAFSTACGAPDELPHARCLELLAHLEETCAAQKATGPCTTRVRSGLDGSGMLLERLLFQESSCAGRPLALYERGEDACWMLHNRRVPDASSCRYAGQHYPPHESKTDAQLRNRVRDVCFPKLQVATRHEVGFSHDTHLTRMTSIAKHFSEEAQRHFRDDFFSARI